MSTPTIKRAFVRRYRDNGAVTAYVEWSDGSRTESELNTGNRYIGSGRIGGRWFTFGGYMHALFQRAKREGIKLERETW